MPDACHTCDGSGTVEGWSGGRWSPAPAPMPCPTCGGDGEEEGAALPSGARLIVGDIYVAGEWWDDALIVVSPDRRRSLAPRSLALAWPEVVREVLEQRAARSPGRLSPEQLCAIWCADGEEVAWYEVAPRAEPGVMPAEPPVPPSDGRP